MTHTRKQALVPSSILLPHANTQTDRSSGRHTRPQRPSPEVAATTLAEPDETLVADPRGSWTPSQMVDQKLLALSRIGNPGLFLQAAGRPQDIRRLPR